MRLFAVSAAILILGASSARADSYYDFSRGLSAMDRGDYREANALLSNAISAGDLNKRFLPVAYFDRGAAQYEMNECAKSLPDFSASIQLKPDYSEAYAARADAERCVADYQAAIADWSSNWLAAERVCLFQPRPCSLGDW